MEFLNFHLGKVTLITMSYVCRHVDQTLLRVNKFYLFTLPGYNFEHLDIDVSCSANHTFQLFVRHKR